MIKTFRTTKKVFFNSVIRELLWYLSGETHIRNLRQYTKIWDAWTSESKKWEVIELPTNNVITTYDFEEDAEETAIRLNEQKPFGDGGFPNFLTHK